MTITGEGLHAQGADGARRAKLWLEATTRASVHWVNPDTPAVSKLSFPWKSDRPSFSFDLGGVLIGGTKDNEEFLAECKLYKDAGDQNALYDEYLAKCYCALDDNPSRCDNFMWITWAAFATTTWSELRTADRVRKATVHHCVDALGVDADAAESTISDDHCAAVAQRLWVLVLSELQEEHLVLTPEHQGLIRGEIARKAAES